MQCQEAVRDVDQAGVQLVVCEDHLSEASLALQHGLYKGLRVQFLIVNILVFAELEGNDNYFTRRLLLTLVAE